MNEQPNAIFIRIACPTMDEAKKLSSALLEKKLCGTVGLYDNSVLMFDDNGQPKGENVVFMHTKSTPDHLKEIETFIYENHSWGQPCVDVVPILVDHC